MTSNICGVLLHDVQLHDNMGINLLATLLAAITTGLGPAMDRRFSSKLPLCTIEWVMIESGFNTSSHEERVGLIQVRTKRVFGTSDRTHPRCTAPPQEPP
jgi:hypothetical protein